MMRLSKLPEITIGSDPELFIISTSEGRTSLIPAAKFFGGTKENPLETPGVEGSKYQVDGLALEINTKPCTSRMEFTTELFRAIMSLQGMLPRSCRLTAVPTVSMDKKSWDKIPREQKQLGCEPSYNAYSCEQQVPSKDFIDTPIRTGGGHIHIGFPYEFMPELSEDDTRELVKQLDCLLYPASLLWDRDTERRSIYGQVGSYRPKPYGLEYRVLSNAWVSPLVSDNTTIPKLVFTLSRLAVRDYLSGKIYMENKDVASFIKHVSSSEEVTLKYANTHLRLMHDKFKTPLIIP